MNIYVAPEKDYVTPEEYDAVGDGTTDDYTALYNTFAAAGKNHKNVRFTTGKTYYVVLPASAPTGISIPSNTAVWGNHSEILVKSEDAPDGVKKELFAIPDFHTDITIEGLKFRTVRDKNGVVQNDRPKPDSEGVIHHYSTSPPFYDSNIIAICIYRGTRNIKISDCDFYGFSVCIDFDANSGNAQMDTPALIRDNIVIKNITARQVNMCIVGGRRTNNVLIENIDIETALTNKLSHAIYLNSGYTNLTIRGFRIRQNPTEGHPISIYNMYENKPPRSSRIYLCDGEVHAGSLGDASTEYYVCADNIKTYSDTSYENAMALVDRCFADLPEEDNAKANAYNEYRNYLDYVDYLKSSEVFYIDYEEWKSTSGAYTDYYSSATDDGIAKINALDDRRLVFTFWEESYGEFTNCDFFGHINKGIYRNCRFSLFNFGVFLSLVTPAMTGEACELILFDNCDITMEQPKGAAAITGAAEFLISAPEIEASQTSISVVFRDCLIEFSGDYYDADSQQIKMIEPKAVNIGIVATACDIDFVNCRMQHRENGELIRLKSGYTASVTEPMNVTYSGCSFGFSDVHTKTIPNVTETIL